MSNSIALTLSRNNRTIQILAKDDGFHELQAIWLPVGYAYPSMDSAIEACMDLFFEAELEELDAAYEDYLYKQSVQEGDFPF